MAEDLWRRDDDPHVAHCESVLSDAGAAYLYHVQAEVLHHLGMPPLTMQVVQEVYRAVPPPLTFSKAQGGAWTRAQAFFSRAMETLDAGKRIRDLARAVTESWYARGLLEGRVSRAVMAAYLIGRAQGSGQAYGRVDDIQAHAAKIIDPSRAGEVVLASERACEHMQILKDQTRAMIADEVLTTVLEQRSPADLAIRLNSRFGVLNRDWRRVAVTEIAQARAHGWLSSIPDGEKVQWVAAPDACPHCLRYHGQEFTVGKGDFQTHVWPGKSNRGRSPYTRTRTGAMRGRDELYGPTIPLHPVCRCRFIRVLRRHAGVSNRMQAYLDSLVERAAA